MTKPSFKTKFEENPIPPSSNLNLGTRPKRLTALELKCMKALWFKRAKTIREIQGILRPTNPLAYTTILTIMDRLAQKGFVGRHKQGRAHVYHPNYSFETSRQQAVRDLIECYFNGSTNQLISVISKGSTENQTSSKSNSTKKSPTSPPLNECLL